MPYSILRPNLPQYDQCAFCLLIKKIEATVHFHDLGAQFPRGLYLDCCAPCFQEHQNDFASIGFHKPIDRRGDAAG